MSYKDLTIKTIYGRSYNECNHPDCTQLIIEVDPNTSQVVNYGEIAQIWAKKPGGERRDKDYPEAQLNLPDNLRNDRETANYYSPFWWRTYC